MVRKEFHVTLLEMVRWFNVDCAQAEGFYFLNDEIAAEREANSPSAAGWLIIVIKIIIVSSYQPIIITTIKIFIITPCMGFHP